MRSYIKSLEKQNDELKEKLAESQLAEPWMPYWIQHTDNLWHYENKFITLGIIQHEHGRYKPITSGGAGHHVANWASYKVFADAKNFIEQNFSKARQIVDPLNPE